MQHMQVKTLRLQRNFTFHIPAQFENEIAILDTVWSMPTSPRTLPTTGPSTDKSLSLTGELPHMGVPRHRAWGGAVVKRT
eukprot:1497659-Prymnesium_polylepis.1